MIQDIGDAVYHVEYTPEKPEDQDIVFTFKPRRVFAKMDEEKKLFFPIFGMVKDQIDRKKLRYLFKISDVNYYWYDDELELEGYNFEISARMNGQKSMRDAFAGMTAYHLYVWYNSHRYCGTCGAMMEHMDKERAMFCPNCGNRSYPVIAPAVIIGVVNGDEILITRYAGREYKGVALLAGFCEIGDKIVKMIPGELGLPLGVEPSQAEMIAFTSPS